jgi:hypothetical protein
MLRALQGDIVETRIIRSNYGISFKELWDPAIHESPEKQRTAAKNKYEVLGPSIVCLALTKHRAFDEQEQKWFCTQVMRWYVKRVSPYSRKQFQDILTKIIFDYYNRETNSQKRNTCLSNSTGSRPISTISYSLSIS